MLWRSLRGLGTWAIAGVCVMLAGRAAEELCLGDVSTGAADDLLRATRIARSMIVQYGMDPTLGAQSLDLSDTTEPLPLPMPLKHATYDMLLVFARL